jgi:hypothetical protein
MAFRAAKKDNGVIIAIGNDEDQVGNYPVGASNEEKQGTWCTWTFDEIPTFSMIEGVDTVAMRFKENASGDGIELRADEDVIANPQG